MVYFWNGHPERMAVLRCVVQVKAFLCCVNLPLKIGFPIPHQGVLNYRDPVFLIGSCFTEDIGLRFRENLFQLMLNPNGILYNPDSVATALKRILNKDHYRQEELFYRNELYHTWYHHGSFSGPNERETLDRINRSLEHARAFLSRKKLHLFITFASMRVFTREGVVVANCHKYPSDHFESVLLNIEDQRVIWTELLEALFAFNPAMKVWFTVSPVRHIRDGIVENARSKARTLELVHQICAISERCSYFPSYEIVMDELRDYRYFERDMAHPNHLAVDYIWDRLIDVIPDAESKTYFADLQRLNTMLNHRVLHPGTNAHKAFESRKTEAMDIFRKQYGRGPSDEPTDPA